MLDRHPAKRCIHHWPTRFLCVFVLALQTASINWYLMNNISITWAAIYGADIVVIGLFVIAIILSSRNIYKEKHTDHVTADDLQHIHLTYLAWLVYAILLDIKVAVIFLTFSTNLDESNFFGPNTLKTTLALSGVVFLTFLSTQHDVKSGTRKALIVSLTSAVIFDIFDGVDILENLYDKKVRDTFPSELNIGIISLFCVNFLLPTVPLFILAKTKFALNPLPEKLELYHKFALAFLVNFPLFVIRMVTWNGLSQGISIFLLKNVIAMAIATFEMGEFFLCVGSEEKEEQVLQMQTDRCNTHHLTECVVSQKTEV